MIKELKALKEQMLRPAVIVRVQPDTGPSVTVEWRDRPTPGEIMDVSEALIKAARS